MSRKIPFDRFLQCHLDCYEKFRRAERTFSTRKADLLKSADSLISHPEITERYKSQLLKFKTSLGS